MPQALKPLSLIHIGKGEILPTPIIGLWGNKNGLPSMKVQKLKIFQNNIGLKGCKLSSLNAPGTESLVSHSGWDNSNFPSSWGIKKLTSGV